MPAPRASEAVIRNAINAAKACGIVVGVVEVAKDGSVRIIAAKAGEDYQKAKPKYEW